MLFVTPGNMGSIEPIHGTIRYRSSSDAFVIPERDIRLRPGKHLEATSGCGSKVLWYATKSEAEHMVHVDAVPATYGKLAAQELRFSVYIDGKRLEDFYCRPQDLASLPTESARLAQLEAQYGRKMPVYWQHCVENIPVLLEFTDRASEGWLPLYEMEWSLGIDNSAKALERWAEHFKFPFIQHPYQGTKIYAPISFDSLVEHPDFSAFLDVVFGRSADFARRCILDDRARRGAGAQQNKAAA